MEASQVHSFKIKSHIRNYSVDFVSYKDVLEPIISEGDIIIVDNFVYKLHCKFYEKLKNKINIIQLESTERNKEYFYVGRVIDKIIDSGFNKTGKLIGIGGGVIQDITGFIASILFRGVDWIFVPTTLLSQGDSCIGGKTSINSGKYKNQIGNFYPPNKIIIDTNFIDSLPGIDYLSGLGEMSHYFLISGTDDFEFFKNNWDKKDKIEQLIFRSLEIKKNIIEIDEFDKKERQVFNYGHSFGHSIEALTNYTVPHGIAVSYGMDIANFVSFRLGYVSEDFVNKSKILLNNFFGDEIVSNAVLSLFGQKHFSKMMIETLKKDKKSTLTGINLILTKGYGKMFKTEIKLDKEFIEILDEYRRNNLKK